MSAYLPVRRPLRPRRRGVPRRARDRRRAATASCRAAPRAPSARRSPRRGSPPQRCLRRSRRGTGRNARGRSRGARRWRVRDRRRDAERRDVPPFSATRTACRVRPPCGRPRVCFRQASARERASRRSAVDGDRSGARRLFFLWTAAPAVFQPGCGDSYHRISAARDSRSTHGCGGFSACRRPVGVFRR